MRKKTVAMLMAAMLIFGGAMGATVAWLTASTAEVVNIFTYGNVDIKLEETKPLGQTAKMVPGDVIEKDPKVTVTAGSEPCYVFVKITPSANYETFFGKFTSEDVAEGWMLLAGTENVFYREAANEAPNAFNPLTNDWTSYILKGTDAYPNGAVTVSGAVTKADMDELKVAGTDGLPTLSFQAYAVQKANMENAQAAWQQVNPSGN